MPEQPSDAQMLTVLVAWVASPIFIVVELLLFRWMMKRHRVAPKWATAVALAAGGAGVYLYGWITKALAPPARSFHRTTTTRR